MPLDEEVGRRLRYITKPIMLIANKCDDAAMAPQADDFYKLGRGKALPCVSAEQNRGRDMLLRVIARQPAASGRRRAAERR